MRDEDAAASGASGDLDDTDPALVTPADSTDPHLPERVTDYVPPRLPPVADVHQTLDDVKVRLAADIDPAQAPTEPSMRARARRRRYLLVGVLIGLLVAVAVVGLRRTRDRGSVRESVTPRTAAPTPGGETAPTSASTRVSRPAVAEPTAPAPDPTPPARPAGPALDSTPVVAPRESPAPASSARPKPFF